MIRGRRQIDTFAPFVLDNTKTACSSCYFTFAILCRAVIEHSVHHHHWWWLGYKDTSSPSSKRITQRMNTLLNTSLCPCTHHSIRYIKQNTLHAPYTTPTPTPRLHTLYTTLNITPTLIFARSHTTPHHT